MLHTNPPASPVVAQYLIRPIPSHLIEPAGAAEVQGERGTRLYKVRSAQPFSQVYLREQSTSKERDVGRQAKHPAATCICEHYPPLAGENQGHVRKSGIGHDKSVAQAGEHLGQLAGCIWHLYNVQRQCTSFQSVCLAGRVNCPIAERWSSQPSAQVLEGVYSLLLWPLIPPTWPDPSKPAVAMVSSGCTRLVMLGSCSPSSARSVHQHFAT